MEKMRLTDSVVSMTGRNVAADRKVCHETLTYEPHGSSGKDMDVNQLVYELMLLAGRDMLDVGKTVYGGDFTAAEMAGRVGYLKQFMDNSNPDWEDYECIRIKTRTFECSFDACIVFEQIAEWEGVAGITAAKAYRFHADGKEMPKGMQLKKYTRCHGYKPTTVSLTAENARIAKRFEVLGDLCRSLTSEGVRKALSVIAAASRFSNMSYEWRAMAKQAMLCKLWKDYAKKGASLTPVAFDASDFNGGPACYQVVDDKYADSLVNHFRKMMADSPKPKWPDRNDVVMFKDRDVWNKKKYMGSHLVNSVQPRLSLYGDYIEWTVAVCVGKHGCEYFRPGQLEPWVDPRKSKTKNKTKKTDKPVAKSQRPTAVKVKDSGYTVKSDGKSETFASYVPASAAGTPEPDISELLAQAIPELLAA